MILSVELLLDVPTRVRVLQFSLGLRVNVIKAETPFSNDLIKELMERPLWKFGNLYPKLSEAVY